MVKTICKHEHLVGLFCFVVLQVYDEAKSEMAVNDLWSFVCTEVPEMCRPRPPPTTRYVRTTTKKSRRKVPKRLRKLRKRNMLQRYNISLNHTLMLAERFWEHKIQKMLAQGCTTDRQWRKTTPRSSRRTTVTVSYTHLDVYKRQLQCRHVCKILFDSV